MKEFGRYRIIQLYTHAADSGHNGEPVIWFADSALLLSDLVYEGRNAGRLIVLSACETGKGKFYLGEGVFGFNRGFAALGIPSSVSNLWSVNNTAAYRITELFYKYLSKGLPSDVALQKAKIEFRESASKEESLPYYWASSVFAGISEPVIQKESSSWYWIVFAMVAVFLFIIPLFKKKFRNKHSYTNQQKTGFNGSANL
jgi:CHAT domain-containing protein